MRTLYGREPVAIVTALRSIILAFVAFGLDVSAEQVAAIMLAVEAVLGVVTRQSVYAPANVVPPNTSE